MTTTRTPAEFAADLIAAYKTDRETTPGYCRNLNNVVNEIEEAGLLMQVKALLPHPDYSEVERIESRYVGVDQKGRRITGYAEIRHAQSTISTRCGFVPFGPAGFEVSIRVCRNGIRFGAIPRSTFYLTVEEARVHAHRGLAAQAKRYAAKFGGEVL